MRSGPLTKEERGLLKALGAPGGMTEAELVMINQDYCRRLVELRLEVMHAAYTEEEVMALLNLGREELEAMIKERAILAVIENQASVFPRFQFNNGRLLPNWSRVFQATRPDVSILALYRFMMTPSADFEVNGEKGAPRDWLIKNPMCTYSHLSRFLHVHLMRL